MKIRTKEELQDLLAADLGWRKKELTTLNANVKTASYKNLPTSLRCAIVMLYAHWEGFIKNASEYYLNYVKYQRLQLDQLNPNLLALSLKQKLNEFTQSDKATIHVRFIKFFQQNLNERASFSEINSIKTKSNLSSAILKEIFTSIGIDFTPYELKSNLIDSQLLYYRNNIAHGNFLPLDSAEYNNLHNEIVSMLNGIFNDISNAIVLDSFKK